MGENKQDWKAFQPSRRRERWDNYDRISEIFYNILNKQQPKQQLKKQLNQQSQLLTLLKEHADHIPGAYLLYADHKDRATLPIGLNDWRKRRATVAYGRQLKMVWES